MNQETLIETAASLPLVESRFADEYASKRDVLVATVNDSVGRRLDLDALIGPNNREMMENNHANHARFVHSVLRDFEPEVLVDTVLWVFRAYRSHGFHLTYWPAQLNAWVAALRQHLSGEAFDAIYPLYDWFIIRQPAFADLADAQLENPVGGTTPSHGA